MKRFMLAGLAAMLFMAACQRGPTAQDVLNSASENMTSADTLKFSLERVGDPVQVTLGDTPVGVAGATGEYQAPDSVHATVKATVAGMVSEGEVLWIGSDVYFKHPLLSPDYKQIPVEGFNAPGIFSATSGIPNILKTLTNAQLGDAEDIDGVQAYHLTATAPGEQLTGLTGAPLAAGDASLDIWIATETNQVVRIEVTEADGNGWKLDLFDYGQPVEIPAPPAS